MIDSARAGGSLGSAKISLATFSSAKGDILNVCHPISADERDLMHIPCILWQSTCTRCLSMSIRGMYLLYERQPDCLRQALQRNGCPSAPHPALWLAAYPTSSVLFLSACARARCFVSLPTRHPQDPGSNNKPSCLRPKSIYCRCLSGTGILASLAAVGPDSLPALRGGWVWWDGAAQAPAPSSGSSSGSCPGGLPGLGWRLALRRMHSGCREGYILGRTMGGCTSYSWVSM